MVRPSLIEQAFTLLPDGATTINPRFRQDGGNRNCTRVTAALELATRGYSVAATPRLAPDNNTRWFARHWIQEDGAVRAFEPGPGTKSTFVAHMLDLFPDGARFAVATPEHMFNAELVAGHLVVADGQSARYAANAPHYLDYPAVWVRPPIYLRLDDLTPLPSLAGWLTGDVGGIWGPVSQTDDMTDLTD